MGYGNANAIEHLSRIAAARTWWSDEEYYGEQKHREDCSSWSRNCTFTYIFQSKVEDREMEVKDVLENYTNLEKECESAKQPVSVELQVRKTIFCYTRKT